MAFSGLVYRKRGRDPSPWFYVAPTGLGCLLLLLPRAMPWATIFRPFGAERNPLYSNPENGLVVQQESPWSGKKGIGDREQGTVKWQESRIEESDGAASSTNTRTARVVPD